MRGVFSWILVTPGVSVASFVWIKGLRDLPVFGGGMKR